MMKTRALRPRVRHLRARLSTDVDCEDADHWSTLPGVSARGQDLPSGIGKTTRLPALITHFRL